MPKLLLMEGNTAEKRLLARQRGLRSSSEIYALAIAAHFPAIELDVVHAADPDWTTPEGRDLSDYDGIVVTGSSLHAYDHDFAITNQIELLRKAARAGLPAFGSCWGLQIAVMAAGGMVAYNLKDCEVGFARKITPTEAGKSHRLFSGKPDIFDAPCIHYDEVTRLPQGAVLLASNAHSQVQAALIPLENTEVWAVQYHPEFDLEQLVQLFTFYADTMIEQGFFADKAALGRYLSALSGLADNPDDKGLAWQLGVGADITDDRLRRLEIINWIETCVIKA